MAGAGRGFPSWDATAAVDNVMRVAADSRGQPRVNCKQINKIKISWSLNQSFNPQYCNNNPRTYKYSE